MSYRARVPGRAGLLATEKSKQEFAALGQALDDELAASMRTHVSLFEQELESFATKHRRDIQQDPVFRAKFYDMCAKLDIDPLVSQRGIWNKVLGIGSFYYGLAIRVIEVCLKNRTVNGGLMSLSEVLQAVQPKYNGRLQSLSPRDIEIAIHKVAVLDSGFRIIDIGTDRFVQSVPIELSMDHIAVLDLCRNSGYTSSNAIQEQLGWTAARADTHLTYLLHNDFAWIDKQGQEGPQFWVLGMAETTPDVTWTTGNNT